MICSSLLYALYRSRSVPLFNKRFATTICAGDDTQYKICACDDTYYKICACDDTHYNGGMGDCSVMGGPV